MCAGLGYCSWFNPYALTCSKPRRVSCPKEDMDEQGQDAPMSEEEKVSLNDFLSKLDAGFFDGLFKK